LLPFFKSCANLLKNGLRFGCLLTITIDDIAKKIYFRAMNRFKNFIEWQAFGVLSSIGDKIGIATSRIRTWFIYISLLTMGSPIIIYMILAFLMNVKRYITARRRNPTWYL
jgi:phage shock protein PspC (stress-responsive transcriptional regulator)